MFLKDLVKVDWIWILDKKQTWFFFLVLLCFNGLGLTGFSGYRMRAGSASPVRRRNGSHHYSPDYDHSDGPPPPPPPPPRHRGFGRGRDSGRFRDHSPPPYGRGRFGGGGRFGGRGFDGGPGMCPGGFRGGGGGDVIPRNNPNVRPREGDWMCTDPTCNNLNFARREYCNNCNRPRYAGPGSPPRRGYPGPPLMGRRFTGPPLDRSPGRSFNGYRSPPRGFGRDGPPREFGIGGPMRREGRFPRDHHNHNHNQRPDYFEDEMRERGNNRFDHRPMVPPPDWGRERKGYDRRPVSPGGPPPPTAVGRGSGRWVRDERERSRSPVRGGLPPPSKDYRRDAYVDRGRDDRRGMGRDPY
ncbi:unnamed protein product [Lactuca virosa]|uniref:RanBP2-type domain-containing protein n=1 Tax=Lactuca virosa TaxID=75947 RepID=A0AAU9N9Q8_9ASTR|nr:unnamed protein product [Lactuca virosa]